MIAWSPMPGQTYYGCQLLEHRPTIHAGHDAGLRLGNQTKNNKRRWSTTVRCIRAKRGPNTAGCTRCEAATLCRGQPRIYPPHKRLVLFRHLSPGGVDIVGRALGDLVVFCDVIQYKWATKSHCNCCESQSSTSATSSSASSSPALKKLWTLSTWCVLLSPCLSSRSSLRVSYLYNRRSVCINDPYILSCEIWPR